MPERTPKNQPSNKAKTARQTDTSGANTHDQTASTIPPQLDVSLMTPDDILALQRMIGNEAVGQLLAQRQTMPDADPDDQAEDWPPIAANPFVDAILAQAQSQRQTTESADIHPAAPVVQRFPRLTIQRVLTKKTTRAFKTAAANNSAYSGAEKEVDTNVTKSEQNDINKLRGSGFHKASPQAEKDLKDVIRAYLLRNYAKYVPPVSKSDDKKTKEDRERSFTRTLKEREKHSGMIAKGFTHPETLDWLKYAGFEKIVPKGNKMDPGEPRIDVRSTFIGGKILGMKLRSHLFIILATGDGTEYFFRGGPDGSNPMLTEGVYGKYLPGTVDWDAGAPSVTIKTGPDVMSYLDKLIEATNSIAPMKVPYEAGGPGMTSENCNATAWTILDRAGLPKNKPTGVHSGFDHILGTESKKGKAATPNKEFSGDGIKYEVDDVKEPVQVFHDRELFEKAKTLSKGDKVRLYTDNEDKIRYYDWVPIKYDGDKVGYVQFCFLKKDFSDLPTGTKYRVTTDAEVVSPDNFQPNGDTVFLDSIVEVLDENFINATDWDMEGTFIKIKYTVFGDVQKIGAVSDWFLEKV